MKMLVDILVNVLMNMLVVLTNGDYVVLLVNMLASYIDSYWQTVVFGGCVSAPFDEESLYYPLLLSRSLGNLELNFDRFV